MVNKIWAGFNSCPLFLEKKMKNILIILIFSLGIRAETLININLSANPSNYKGICPITVNFEGEISVSKKCKLQYRFLRSDGKVMPVEVLDFSKKLVNNVKMQWTTQIDLDGWVSIEILSPVSMKYKKVPFSLKCLGIVGPKIMPDLIVKFQGPSSAYQSENLSGKYKLLVSNIGDLESKNFYLDIVLYGWAGREPAPSKEHICGRGFISSSNPGEDVQPAGLMPSIPPDLPPGEYDICAFVDSTDLIKESKEDNNKSCHSIKILEKK